MKHAAMTAMALIALAACSTTPQTSTPKTSVSAPVTGKPSKILGYLEVEFSGIGGSEPKAVARYINPATNGLRASSSGIAFGTGAAPTLTSKSVSFSDDNEQSATAKTRYVQAVFDLNNTSSTTFNNLLFVAAANATSLGGTAIGSMFDGTDTLIPAVTAAPIALRMKPTHGMSVRRTAAARVNQELADLYLLNPNETSILQTAATGSGFTMLEYGFVALNLGGGRSIGNSTCTPAPTCNKGTVTFAFKIDPRENTRSANPWRFNFKFGAVKEPTDLVFSQSLEETTTAAGRATFSAGVKVRTPGVENSSLFYLDQLQPLCHVRTAGTVALPTALLEVSPFPTGAGSLDLCFGAGGRRFTTFTGYGSEGASGVAIQPDGKIVAAGLDYNNTTGSYDFSLVRYLSTGELDSTFGTGGKVQTDIGATYTDYTQAIAIQADGKIVVAGRSNDDFALARYTSAGVLDTTFDVDGIITTDFSASSIDNAYALAIQSDGKLVVVGSTNSGTNPDNFAIARYTTTGALDTSFDTDGKQTVDFGGSYEAAYGVTLQPDGKIIVVGTDYYDFAIARLTTAGALDTTFDTDGKKLTNFVSSSDQANGVIVQPDGKILVGGWAFNTDTNTNDFALARFSSTGASDNTFGFGGRVITDLGTSHDDRANAIALQSNGKIVLVGYSYNGTDDDFAVARFESNGSLDSTFDGDGVAITKIGGVNVSDQGKAIAIQSNGKIVVAGSSYVNSTNGFALARYNP
jgi:uncharacterized delta-60 repeat protein